MILARIKYFLIFLHSVSISFLNFTQAHPSQTMNGTVLLRSLAFQSRATLTALLISLQVPQAPHPSQSAVSCSSLDGSV